MGITTSTFSAKAFALAVLTAFLLPMGLSATAPGNNKKLTDEQVAQITSNENKSISFVENKGQWPAHVLYRADVAGGQMLATPDGMLIGVFDRKSMSEVSRYDMEVEQIQSGHRSGKIEDLGPAPALKGFGWRLNFIGGNKSAAENIEKEGQNVDFSNFLTGDASTTATNVHSYNVITYKDVYQGINVKYYTAAGGNLENDIIVKPGANANQINMQIEGVESLKMNGKGELILPTSVGDMTIPSPVSYLIDANGKRTSIKIKYHLLGKNQLSFEIPAYDNTQTLVIDPIVMRWATWIASNTSVAAHCHGVDLDAAGNIYVVSRGGNGLVTVGAFQTTYTGTGGAVILWISKYQEPVTPGGSGTCVWQTYLGGTATSNPYACSVGLDGYLYIAGITNQNLNTTYGTGAPTPTWTQRTSIGGGQQVFIAKINPAGTWAEVRDIGSVTASLNPNLYDLRIMPTGGSNFDLLATGYVTQQSTTTADGDIPVAQYANGTAVTTGGGKTNGYIFRLSSDLNTLRWTKQYTSAGNTNQFFTTVVDGSGNILIGGNTNGNANVSYTNATQATLTGTQDGWLMSLDSSTGNAHWSRYFNSGAAKSTSILCMELNQQKTQVVIGGLTSGLAAANISAGAYQTTYPGSSNRDFFIASLPVAATSTTWGTYFGGNANNGADNMMGLNIDQNNDVFILGYTNSKFTPTTIPAAGNPLQTSAYDAANYDAIFFKLSGSTGDTLLYYTYLGGRSNEEDPTGERGIKFNNCRIYLAITSESNDFPLTRGTIDSVYTPANGSVYLPLVVSMANPPDLLGNSITSGGNQTISCGQAPQLITASTPAYIIPTVIRNGVGQANASAGAYPGGLPTISSYQWQYSINNGITWTSIPGATTQNYTPAAIDSFTGTYLFRRIINGDYCSLTGDTLAEVTVIVTPAYAPPAITTNSPLCAGQTLTLTTPAQAGFTYSWTGPSAFASTIQSPTVANVSGANVGYYYLTEKNTANGCPSYPDSALVAITLPLPAPTAGSNSVVCAGDTLKLTALGTGTAFNWTGPNNYTATVQNPVIANATSTNAGTYQVTQSAGGSCVSPPASVTVVINTTTAPVAGNNGPLCSGNTLNLTATTVSGATYSWTGPNGFTSTLQNPGIPNATGTSSGTYTVIATVGSCSSAPATTTVTISPAPSAPVAGNNGPLCETNALNLTANNIPGATYSWTGPNGFTSTLQNPTINSVTVADSGVYYVVATISGCVSDTGSTDVVVSPTPATPNVSSNSPVCQNGTLNLNVDTTAGATYAWTGPNGFTSTLPNPSITNVSSANAGSYNVVVTLNGCSSGRAIAVVNINTSPTPVATSNSPVCAGGTLNLFGTSVNGASYSWTGPNGFTSTNQNPTITNISVLDSGTYFLNVTSKGCVSDTPGQVTVVVTITPAPVASNNSPICSGDTLHLTASTVPNATYTWTGPNGFISNVQNPSIIGATTAYSGDFFVLANISGCNSSDSAATTVVINPVPVITAGNNGPICDSTSLFLTASTFEGATYVWTGPNGFSSTDQNPAINVATLPDSGTYYVTATASGCTSSAPASTVVIINALPPAPVTGSNSPLCEGNNLNLTASNIANATYSWTGPNGFTSTLQNPTVQGATIAAAGSYTVIATVLGCGGAAGTTTVVVNQIPSTPKLASNSPICEGATLNLTAGLDSGAVFSWTGPNGFTSTVQNPSITNVVVADSGVYTLTETVNGCSSAPDSLSVIIYALPPAPNAGSNSPVCVGDSLFLTAANITGATYAWTDPAGFSSTDQNPVIPNVSLSDANTYTVSATTNGCTGPGSSVVVTISSRPLASFTSTAPQCAGSPVDFTNTGSTGGGFTFSWNFGSTGTPTTSTSENPTGVIFSTGGNIPVIFTVANGVCSTIDTQAVPITGTPQARFINDGPACFPPGIVTFTDSSTGSITSWLWNFGAGATPATSTSPGPIAVTYAAIGVQTVSLTVSSGACSSTTTEIADVGVVGADFTSSVPQNGDNGCLNQPVNFYTIGSEGTGAQNYWNFGSGAVPDTSTAENPAGILYTTTGAKIVTHIVYSNNCNIADTIIHIVTINPIPVTTFTSTSPVCGNTPVNFTNTGSSGVNYTYFWDLGAGASPATSTTENPAGITYASSGTKTVSFSITNGFYCVITATQNVIVNSTPTASFASTAPQCTTLPVDFTNTGTTTGVTYAWNFGANATPAISTNQNPTGVTYSTPGIQLVALTTTDNSSGCADSVTHAITINQNPTASFTTNAPQCSTSGINFTNTGSTGGTWAYTWNFGQNANPAISSAESPSGVMYGSSGSKTVTFTISGQGCTQTSTQTIVVDTTPVAAFTSTAPQCTGANVDFTNTGTATGVTYAWDFGAGATPATSTSQNPTGIVYSTSGSKTITLVVTNVGSGCTSTVTHNININLTPVASFTSNAPQCSTSPINFTNTGSTGGNWSYAWDLGQGAIPSFSSSENPGGVMYSSSGTKTITFTISSQFCTQTSTQSIVINPTPVASFTSTAPQCTGLGVNFTNTGTTTGVSYAWNFGASATPATDTVANPSGVVYSTAGTKTVTLTTTDTSSGCSVTATNNIVIHLSPVASFTSNAPQCSTVPINFTNTGSTGGNWSYNWDFGDGANPAISSAQNPSGVLYSSSGTKTVTFIISDQNCTQSATQNIVINPTPTAGFTTTAPQCTGLGVDFAGNGSSTNVTWSWNFGAGATPATDTVQNVTGVIYSTAGSKTVTLTATDTTSGCSVTASNTFVIHQTPTASFTSNAPQCATVPINFTNTGSTGNNWSYSWNLGQNAIPAVSSAENPSGVLYSSSGTKIVTFTISDQNCTQTTAQNIVINPTPSASFNSTAPQCTGLPVNFNNTGTVTGVTWLWNFGNGATPATDTVQNPSGVVYSTAGIQSVTLTTTDTSSGCSVTVTNAIAIHQTPTASFTSTAPQCAGIGIDFTNTGSTGGNWSYGWSFGPGASPAVSTTQNPTGVMYTSSGSKVVTFTISDQNCTQTSTDTINIFTTPVATFTSNAPKCTGLPVDFVNTGTSNGVTWLWNFGAGATPATSTLQYPSGIIYANAGIMSVSLTISDTSSACAVTTTNTIIINQTPTASFTSNAPQCAGAPINFTNTGSTGSNWVYSWDFGANAIPAASSAQNPSGVLYDSSGTKVVTFTISNASCAQSVTDTITIGSSPVASFTSTAPQCSGLPVDFTSTGTPSGVSWAWNFGTNSSPGTSVSQNPSGVIYSAAGITIVTLTVTDLSTQCTGTVSNAINIYQTPTASFTSNAPQCVNVPVNFNNTGSTGSNWTYAWDFGANAIPGVSSSQNPSGVLYDSSGAKSVTLIVSDAHCSQTAIDTITISNTPVASFTSTAPQCTGLPVGFTNTGTSTGVTWSWNLGSGALPSTSTLQNPSGVIYSSAGINAISLTITDASTLCTAIANSTINIYQTPTATFTSSAPQCTNAPVNFLNTGSTGANWSYAWDFGQNALPAVSSSQNPTGVMYDSSGVKAVTFTISDAHCSQTTIDTIIINNTPVASFTSTAPQCTGLPVNFTNTGTSTGVSWSWNLGTGSSPSTSSLQNPSGVIYSNAGIVAVTLTISDNATLCTATANGTINIYQTPTATFTSNSPQCANVPINFNNTGSTGAPWAFVWDFGQNALPAGSTSENPGGVLYDSSGAKTVTFTISDAHCSQTATQIITVNPLPIANAGLDTTICANRNVTLGGHTLTPGASYSWFPSSTLDNPFVPNPLATPTASITTYSVTVTAAGTGCISTDYVIVTMRDPLIANAGPDVQICLNDTTEIGAGLVQGQFYSWSPATGLSSVTSPNPIASPTQTTTYTVVVTDTAGCAPVSDNVTVIVNPLPNANAGPDDTIQTGGSVQLTGTGGVQYVWSPSTGLNNANIFDPVASPDSSTIYVLTVTNVYGCMNTDTMEVHVFNYAVPWWIPSAFTPNGDGHNDVLYVRGGGFETFEFSIYNRYGELIFDSKNINEGWDGTNLKGQLAPIDAYVYKLYGKLNDGSTIDTKGLVNLVR